MKDLIQMMEDEFTFWIENRMTTISINDEVHTLAHYTSNVSYPRPGINQRKINDVYNSRK